MKRRNPDSFPIKVTLLLTSSLTVMAGATIAPCLPAMQEHFANVDHVEYLVKLALTIPALFIALSGSLAGYLIDRFGRKPLLIGSTLLFACAGSEGFMLDSLWGIIFSRALLGLSVAGTMTGVMTIISDYYQGQKQANFMGLQAASMGIGGVVFISISGIVADFNWRFPFLIYLFALVVLVLICTTLYEPRLENTESVAYRDNRLKPPRELLGGIYLIAFLYMVTYFLIPVQIPFYLHDISNSSAAESGIAIAASTLAGAIASSRYGALKKSLNFSTIVIIAFVLTAIGLFVISWGHSYQLVLCGLIIGGLGFGLMMPNLSVWLMAIAPDFFRGKALGGLTTFIFLGQFMSPILFQPLINIVELGNTYNLTGVLLLQVALTLLVVKISSAFITKKSQKSKVKSQK
jgi:MFS family permease